VECKRVDAPRLTPSMRAAMKDLELSALLVIYPGSNLIRWTGGGRRYLFLV